MIPALLLACLAPQEPWTQAELESMSARIQTELEELRGERFARPVAVQLASSEAFLAYVKARMAKSSTPEQLAADEVIAKLLGAIPVDLDLQAKTLELIESQVGGFYDPESDSFSLMERCSKGVAPMILAHELDHALDDQLFDLDGKMLPLASVTDRSLAFSAVVEGSGTNLMTQWQLRHGGELDVSGVNEMQAEASEGMAQAPMWLWKPLLGIYMRGSCFLTRSESLLAGLSKPAESADIRAAFQDPPRSTEQVLHPEKYWDPARRDDPLTVRIESARLPDGCSVLREDVLGELMLAIALTPGAATRGLDASDAMSSLAVDYTNTRAAGWGGDALVLVGCGPGRFLRLVTAWDSVRDAGEFLGGLEALLPGLEAAALALSDDPKNAGVTLEYGDREDVVVLTCWYSLGRRERRKLADALKGSVGPAEGR